MLKALALSLALAASAHAAAPGTGWSRADDLQVYGAFDMARDLAKERRVLCENRAPGRVEARWRKRFGAREDALEAALSARYGRDALELATLRRGDRLSCDFGQYYKWSRAHARLIRALELRVAGFGSRG